MTEYTKKQYALSYAKKGLAVFPLKTKSKKPATKNGFKDATTDFNIIKNWWNKNPDYNIGIATGNGLLVIDLDVDENTGKNGYYELKDWELDNGNIPETCRTITGRGGNHLLFKTDKVVGNRANVLDGVDVRGDGGYIVAPPSVHPNGRLYEWEQDFNDYEIAEANDTVLSLVNYNDFTSFNEPFHLKPAINDGERNTTLFKLASSLQEKGLSDSAILKAVLEENETRCNPPLPKYEVEIIVKSSTKYKKGDYTSKKEVKKTSSKLELINLNSIEETITDWLWFPYIPYGKITIMQGEPGSSKTTLACKIVACSSKGELFLGEDDYNPFIPDGDSKRNPIKVLYQITEDGFEDTIKKRLRLMNADFNNIFTIDESKDPLTFTDDRISQAIEQTGAKLIIFDPLASYIGSDINMNMVNEVRPIMNVLMQIAKKYNIAILIVAHTSKMTSAQAKNRLIGSIDFVGSARSVLTIGYNPKDRKQRAMAHTKSNLAKFGETILYDIDYDNGVIVFDSFSDLTDDEILARPEERKKPSPAVDEAKDFLIEVMKEGYIKADEVLQMAEEKGIKKQTLYNARKDLGIESKRFGYGKGSVNYWRYPDKEPPQEKNETETP